jgi:hypothetical protein
MTRLMGNCGIAQPLAALAMTNLLAVMAMI